MIKILVLFLFLSLQSTAFAGGGGNDVYIDPLIYDVLQEKGAVKVVISFRVSELPADLGRTQQERAQKLVKIREKDFAASMKTFAGYLGADGEDLEITGTSAIAVSVTAIIRTTAMLEKIAQFPQVKSLHWADAKMTTYSASPLADRKSR
ncbi:MAG TPA: hypothetical protein VF267_04475 [Gammaproteobacteria bacterium]